MSSWFQRIEGGHRAGSRRQLATAGPLPFKAKEFVLMLSERGTVLVLKRAPQAPEVMLDDAVQARPDRLRPQQLRNFQGGSSTPTRDEHDSQDDG